jgi:hypothetical protein
MYAVRAMTARSRRAERACPGPVGQGLKDTGFVEGENVAIEYRWADNQIDRLPALATELVQRRVAVIPTGGPPAAFQGGDQRLLGDEGVELLGGYGSPVIFKLAVPGAGGLSIASKSPIRALDTFRMSEARSQSMTTHPHASNSWPQRRYWAALKRMLATPHQPHKPRSLLRKSIWGEQPAIVDRELFEAVQAKLSEQVNGHKAARMKSEAPLIGRIFDDRGNRAEGKRPGRAEELDAVTKLLADPRVAGASLDIVFDVGASSPRCGRSKLGRP